MGLMEIVGTALLVGSSAARPMRAWSGMLMLFMAVDVVRERMVGGGLVFESNVCGFNRDANCLSISATGNLKFFPGIHIRLCGASRDGHSSWELPIWARRIRVYAAQAPKDCLALSAMHRI